MKLLLDESVPIRLADCFPLGFEIASVARSGWAGMKNGILLARAAAEGFDALITADQGIEYQQNPRTVEIRIVILAARRHRVQELGPLVPRVADLLRGRIPPGMYRVTA